MKKKRPKPRGCKPLAETTAGHVELEDYGVSNNHAPCEGDEHEERELHECNCRRKETLSSIRVGM